MSERSKGGDRFKPLYELAFQYIDVDNNMALYFIEEAEHAAAISGDSLFLVKSSRVKGQVLYKLERTGEAIAALEWAFFVAGRNGFISEVKMSANTLGSAYLYRGQFDKALEFYVRAYDLSATQQDSFYMAMSQGNIAIVYYKLTDFATALEYLQRSVRIRAPQSPHEYNVYTNMSLCYSQIGDFGKAFASSIESRRVCGEPCPTRYLMHIRLATGLAYAGLDSLERAEFEFSQSLASARTMGDSRLTLDNIYCLADMYIGSGRYSEAQSLLEEGDRLVRNGVPFPREVLGIYSTFADLFLSKRDYRGAAYYQSRYIALRDSIYNSELTIKLMRAEAQYRQRENQARIASQQEVIALKDEAIEMQRVLNILMYFLAGALLCVVVMLYRDFRRKKRHAEILEERVKQRTQELECSCDELMAVIREKDVRLHREVQVMERMLGRVRGIHTVAALEGVDPLARSYFQKIEKIVAEEVDQFLQAVRL